MKVFICTDHDGHWPVGCASIVVAKDKEQATMLLRAALVGDGLSPDNFTLQEVPTDTLFVKILHNGDY